jgi:hypothetical protein
MSWDELRTRSRQELDKRLDVGLGWVGAIPRPRLSTAQDIRPAKFFFDPDELPGRIRLLQQYLPSEVESVIREADKVCQHRFRLLGYSDLDYGTAPQKEIDWHLDAVHQKRTPLVSWYKIDFLDFEVAGDHKIIWELNRHQHLVTLAQAWLFTRDERYAREAIDQWYSWQRMNPYPSGINWASSLEGAFRSLSWLWLRHLLEGWPQLPPAFSPDLHRALALHGRHIERYLSTYFSPNTHLLGEAVALFFIGTLCPRISAAERWQQRGWKIIQEAAQRQIRPDGVHFEQSLCYHVYALDMFLHARLLAARNGIAIPASLDDVIRKMLRVIQALAHAGPPQGFGDDDGGRLVDSRRNRIEHMTDPLAVGAAVFRDETLRASATPTMEAIWLIGQEAVANAANPEQPSCQPKSCCFSDGGLYIAAGEHPVQQMMIHACPPGPGRAGHWHADALSVTLSFGGRPWLIDPGTFAYIVPGNERDQFRGTRAHNTLAVDGLDQAQTEGPFAWSALPETRTECWTTGETFALFAGSHSGYERLAHPLRHRRFVFHPKGNFWLVRDVAEGAGSHLLETSWHFAHDLGVATIENGFVASPTSSNDPASAGCLTLLPVPDPRFTSELVTEFVSPVYGAKIPAPVLRCGANIPTPAEHAMLLVASSEPATTERFVRTLEEISSPSGPAAVYYYDCSPEMHQMIFGKPAPTPWAHGPWTSDADFLYVCLNGQRVTHLICCGASFLSFRGDSLFSCDTPIQYVEWSNQSGVSQAFSSDETAARSLSERAHATNNLV